MKQINNDYSFQKNKFGGFVVVVLFPFWCCLVFFWFCFSKQYLALMGEPAESYSHKRNQKKRKRCIFKYISFSSHRQGTEFNSLRTTLTCGHVLAEMCRFTAVSFLSVRGTGCACTHISFCTRSQDNWSWKGPWKAFSPTSCSSRVSYGIRPGFPEFYPAQSWKRPVLENSQALWETWPSTWLSHGKKILLVLSLNLSCFNLCLLFLVLQPHTTWLGLLDDIPVGIGRLLVGLLKLL